MTRLDDPVRGRIDGDGRLVSADPALADLHARAGGAPGGPLAIPQLAALARLARRLAMPVARGVLAADGEEDLDLWVRARPEGGDVAIAIAGWSRRAPVRAILDGGDTAVRDFVRAEADWSWSVDAALRLTVLSREGLTALTRAGGEASLGDPLSRLFLLDEAPGGGAPMLDALAAGRRFDDQHVTLRGTSARFRLAGTPLLDPLGRVRGFDGVAFNLIDEADPPVTASPAMPGDSAFARRLDAALRAPLTRIVAAAESIREQDEGPVRADYGGYAGDIADAGRHLLGLIDDLVDVESLEDDLAIDPEPIDMADVARRAAGLLSVKADDRSMRIERPAGGAKLPCVGDFRRALQVMVNLIANAVRFGPTGSTVHVLVETRGDNAAAMVVDAGRGVAPADRERVFEKFERLGATEPGSGLGLYISRRLARAMGGDLAIEDSPGAGACFVFTLPAD